MNTKHVHKINNIYFMLVFISKIGNGLYFFVATWLIAIILLNPYATAYNLLASILPTIFFSTLIGNLCDKFNSTVICLWADILRFFIVGIISFLILTDNLTITLGILTSLVFYLSSETQQIGWRAILSKNFENIQLLKLNTTSIIGGQSGVVIGAASAGFISHYLGYYYILAIMAFIYLLTPTLTYFIHRILKRPDESLPNHIHNTLTQQSNFKDGNGKDSYKNLIDNKRAVFFYSIMLLNFLILYVINSTLSPFVNFRLKLDAIAFSLIDASYSVGSILGGYIISFYFRKGHTIKIIIATFICLSFSLGLYGFSKTILPPLLCYFFIGACSQNTLIFLTLAQSSTKKNHQARMYSLFNTVTGVIGLLVYSTSTLIIKYNLYTFIFTSLSLLTLIVLLIMFAICVRKKISFTLEKSCLP